MPVMEMLKPQRIWDSMGESEVVTVLSLAVAEGRARGERRIVKRTKTGENASCYCGGRKKKATSVDEVLFFHLGPVD